MEPPPPRADTGWTAEFAAAYEDWAERALPLIRLHEYAQALRTYPYPRFEATPWTALRVPVARARLGIVTTAALYRPGADRSFADTPEGDPTVLGLPSGIGPGDLDIAHGHVPQDLVRADVEIVLPLGAARALVRDGRLGGLGARVPSLVGYRTRAHDVATTTAPAVAAMLAADQVDLALVVPV
jgi:hypothetical protein